MELLRSRCDAALVPLEQEFVLLSLELQVLVSLSL